MSKIHIPVAVGELIDKITILEIKASRMTDDSKLRNVRRELEQLTHVWEHSGMQRSTIESEWLQLRAINEGLWNIEDRKRLKEAAASFDAEFIALARAVYFENDKRAAVKRRINELLGSDIVEEKQYTNYQVAGHAAPRI
jgi:Family of unknown function (DUF6165)